MKRRFSKKVMAAVLAGVMAAGMSTSFAAAAENDDVIRFAVIGPMTGNDAEAGIQQERGVAIAVDEINSAGGINGKMLEYDVFDDQLIAEQTAVCAEKIAATPDDYRFVVSTISSGNTIVACPILEDVDLPVVGYNNSEHVTQQGFTNYVRAAYTNTATIPDLVRIAKEDYGCERPAVLYSTSEVDVKKFELVTELLAAEGLEIAESVKFQPDTDRDFSSFITKFKEADCDCVFLFAEISPTGLFLKQKENYLYDVPVFTSSAAASPEVIEVAGGSACECMITLCGFFVDDPSEKIQNFVKKYTELTGRAPGEAAAGGYDNVMIFADALMDDGADLYGIELIDWMKENLECNNLLTGPCKFDEYGDNEIATCVLLTVRDGKFVRYEDVK